MKKILLFTPKDDQIIREIVEKTKTDPKLLNAEIVGVVANSGNGKIILVAEELQLPFFNFPNLKDKERYQAISELIKADYTVFLNWPLKEDCGLPKDKTISASFPKHFNLSDKQTSITFSFGNNGPIIAEIPVIIRPGDTKRSLTKKLLEAQKQYLGLVLNDIAQDKIFLLGEKVAFKNSIFSIFGKDYLSF